MDILTNAEVSGIRYIAIREDSGYNCGYGGKNVEAIPSTTRGILITVNPHLVCVAPSHPARDPSRPPKISRFFKVLENC
jgi:hypothetical protein